LSPRFCNVILFYFKQDDIPFHWPDGSFITKTNSSDAKQQAPSTQSTGHGDHDDEDEDEPVVATSIRELLPGQIWLVKPPPTNVRQRQYWVAEVLAVDRMQTKVWWYLPFRGRQLLSSNNTDGGVWERGYDEDSKKPMTDVVSENSLEMQLTFTANKKFTRQCLVQIHARVAMWIADMDRRSGE